MVATFNEPIQAGTGNIVITKTADSAVFATIPVGNAPQLVISGSTVTIDPTADLEIGTEYYITIAPEAIDDTSGNSFAGITTSGAWSFTTDGTAPTAVSFSPPTSVTPIAPTSSLSITFSEPINPVGGKFIVLKSGATVIETHEASVFDGVSTSGNVATIALTNPLQFGVSYYVQIESGAFEDNSSNPYTGIPANDTTTWSFSTVDVPSLTGTPYTQTFSAYTSAATLPQGWSFSGAPNLDATYRGTWGTVTPDPGNPAATLGGFLGNASVFGYHHTSLSNTTVPGLVQTLTLRNGTGATIGNLSIAYKGRVNVIANTRIPVFAVSVAGMPVTALGYSTADSDNAQRNASVTGLAIANGATFQIQWSSAYPAGAGSARQIGISDVSVSATNTLYAPTVAALSVPVGTIGSQAAPVQAEVIGDGGQTVTGRGFVYSVTSTNAAPQIGGNGVASIADGAPGVGPFSATLTGLTPATSYTVSAYATNTTGTSYTAFATFTSLATPPTFTGSYTQAFNNYDGTNPAGWTAISDATPPLQAFAGAWGQQASTGGFLGSVTPGVLGYRHTGSSGTLTVTLRLINGTGATLTSFDVSYLGRVNDTEEGRNPIWAVAVNGLAPIEALAYDTAGNIDATRTATVTGLSIAAGQEFSITWKSSRGAGAGSSKQIGIGAVAISIGAAPYSYASWASANNVTGGTNGDHDNDGVKNSLEYFMRATGSSFTANPAIVAGKITWPKEPGFIGSYSVQTSPDLVVWTNVSSTVVGNTVEYTPTGPGKVFVRLQVVVTP